MLSETYVGLTGIGKDGFYIPPQKRRRENVIVLKSSELFDRDGIEIYEGDIVRHNYATQRRVCIELKNGSFGIRDGKNYMIVGNKYEKSNPLTNIL